MPPFDPHISETLSLLYEGRRQLPLRQRLFPPRVNGSLNPLPLVNFITAVLTCSLSKCKSACMLELQLRCQLCYKSVCSRIMLQLAPWCNIMPSTGSYVYLFIHFFSKCIMYSSFNAGLMSKSRESVSIHKSFR